MTGLPLFPLRTVLFPGGLLPLRIFETRYVDMVGRCLREDAPFGVVLIVEGAEVGAVGELAGVGCGARIVDFQQLPGGLLGLMCRGEKRFRLQQRHTAPDGLHVGTVEWLAEAPDVPLSAEQQSLGRVLRRVVDEYGELQRFLQPDFEHAAWVSYRFAELLPLSREQQQSLLEIDAPAERLRRLAPLIQTIDA